MTRSEALVRARLLHHGQVGYYAVRTSESIETRLAYVPYYLHAMTGTEATTEELADFEAFLVSARSDRRNSTPLSQPHERPDIMTPAPPAEPDPCGLIPTRTCCEESDTPHLVTFCPAIGEKRWQA